MEARAGGAAKLIDLYRYGFWVRMRRAPFSAVRWEAQTREDGRPSYRGKNWVEVLPHGVTREPERLYTADVETAGPHEWLDYYPGADEPVCGWGRPRLPDGGMQYCPRMREEGQPFCQKHLHELLDDDEERNLSGEDEPGPGREPVPAADGVTDPSGDSGDGERLAHSPDLRP